MAVKLGNLVFFGHPRMASQAVSDAFLRLGGERIAPNHYSIKLRDGEAGVCVIRNPVKVLSIWWGLSSIKDPIQFLETYRHRFFVPNERIYYHADNCDHYLVYHNLQNDLNNLLHQAITLKHLNVSPKPGPLLDSVAIRCAKRIFEEDFTLWERII